MERESHPANWRLPQASHIVQDVKPHPLFAVPRASLRAELDYACYKDICDSEIIADGEAIISLCMLHQNFEKLGNIPSILQDISLQRRQNTLAGDSSVLTQDHRVTTEIWGNGCWRRPHVKKILSCLCSWKDEFDCSAEAMALLHTGRAGQ